MDALYFIVIGITTDKQGLAEGEFIIKLPSNFPFDFNEGDGPFSSIRELKRKSIIFKNLKRNNAKRAGKIFLEKNIKTIKYSILTPEEESYDSEMIDLFLHCTKGKIKNGKVTGVHFYNKEKVRILKQLLIDQKTKVWRAQIEFFDLKTSKWIKKEKPSDFFPKSWSLTQLFHECNFAYLNMKKVTNSDFKYQSRTMSGIKVEIIVNNGIMKSIYPIID